MGWSCCWRLSLVVPAGYALTWSLPFLLVAPSKLLLGYLARPQHWCLVDLFPSPYNLSNPRSNSLKTGGGRRKTMSYMRSMRAGARAAWGGCPEKVLFLLRVRGGTWILQRQTSRRAVNKHLSLKISSKRDLLKIQLPASPAVLPGSLAAWLDLTHSPAGLARKSLRMASHGESALWSGVWTEKLGNIQFLQNWSSTFCSNLQCNIFLN